MGGKRWPEWIDVSLYCAGLSRFDGAKALAMVVFNHDASSEPHVK